MKNIKGKITYCNKGLVKKTLGTGAFILGASLTSSKPFTIACSIGAGLLISNIYSNIKLRKKDGTKKSKRAIVIEKLKELKEELFEKEETLDYDASLIEVEEDTNLVTTPRVMEVNTVPVKENQDLLGEYFGKRKELKK